MEKMAKDYKKRKARPYLIIPSPLAGEGEGEGVGTNRWIEPLQKADTPACRGVALRRASTKHEHDRKV